MVQTLASGFRTARKRHQCFECYRDIPPGTRYGYQTNKYDHVYTLCWHLDCAAMAEEWRAISDHYYDEEGYPPLRDELQDSGEYEAELERWRGEYPHVVCRMELTDQLYEANK